MPTPEVLTGMRQPRTVRLEEARARAAANPEPAQATPFAPAGITVYISPTRRYLVEIMNVAAYVENGRRYPAKRIAAQFEEGVYRNDHRDPATRKLIDEELQRNRYFGKPGQGHFWLASAQQEQQEAARLKSALHTLKSLPKDVVEQFVAELKQGEAADHDLPPAEAAASKSIRPIQ